MNTKSIKIIPSKSDAHRAFICSALAVLQSRDRSSEDIFKGIICEESSEDIEATKSCLREMLSPDAYGVGVNLYCGESGSTLRFLLPIVGALGIRGIFHPEGRLSKRPLSPFDDELKKHGMRISEPGSIPLISEGELLPGEFHIPGNISSQFVSGLLFALPILDGDSEIIVEGELESAPYVDMTIKTLKAFGITIKEKGENPSKRFIVEGNQSYIHPDKYVVEGDWSNAAFWLAMGAIGKSPIRVEGLNMDSLQGDKSIVEILKRFGAKTVIGSLSSLEDDSFVEVFPSREKMKGIIWDAKETPDLVPVVSVLGAISKGTTRITNAKRLRMKESDRLHSIHVNLRAMGIKVDELEDGLIIHGTESINACEVESHGDHRLAMATAALSVFQSEDGAGKIRLIGHTAVNKSYPAFFRIMSELELDYGIELV